MKADKIEYNLEAPEGVTMSLDGILLTVEGPKGKTSKTFNAPNISLTAEGRKISINASRNTKKERQRFGTFRAHIKNMIAGVQEEHSRKMKVCSSHFPMTVTVNGSDFLVKNFCGEKTPRKLKLPEGVTVKVEGAEIEVSGCDKEKVGNTVSSIEHLTKRTAFDRRIFQDGIIALVESSK